MERSSQPVRRSKGPRVLANTVKKPDKSLNSSSNRSFAKKSSSHYIQDLRNNNAKLAHSLAVEKAKYSALARKFVENEKVHVHQQAEFRTLSRGIKSGVKFLNNSVESMYEGIQILSEVNDKINRLWPETGETVAPQTSVADVNPLCTSSSTTAPTVGDNRSVASQTVPPPKTNVSSPRHGTVMPMVKGQVISKPTISLRRVNVPLGLSNRNRVQLPPTRGTFVDNIVEPNRLSIVSEEVNESREEPANSNQMPSPSNQNSSHVSGPCSTNALPASHVLLERIETDFVLPSSSASTEILVDDDDNTGVIFGRLGYSAAHDDTLPLSHLKKACSKSPPTGKQNTTPPLDTSKSSTDSNEYETESSSEDEGLALQIVESKKSFIERKRQLDSKEGTSWNYDDAGKYHGRPPKRKKSAKYSGSSGTSSSWPQPKGNEHHEDNVPTLRDRRAKTSLEKVISPKLQKKENVCKSQLTVSENGELLQSSENDVMDTTNCEEMSMSFTCVTVTRLPIVLSTNQAETSPESAQQSPKLSEQQQHSERKVFVTQRSHSRRPRPESPDSPNVWRSSLSPLSSRRAHSDLENNENSPPSPVVAVRGHLSSGSSIPEGLSQLPNVVLERLPSNVISGNTYLPDCLDSSIHRSFKSSDTHASHSINRFKCQLANSATSAKVCDDKQLNEGSGNMEKKSQMIKVSKSKEMREDRKSPGSPKVPRVELHNGFTDSEASLMGESKRSPPSEEESSLSQNMKRMVEQSSNATKAKKRCAKSQKSLEGASSSSNPSSSSDPIFPHERGPEEGNQPEMEVQSSNASKPKNRSAKPQKTSEGSHASANSSSATSDGSEHGCVERPKRHAAPTNLKEPKCNRKMRRT
ncbi:rho GTPase-activating protein gacU-like [Thrips palmi]|uniref:Rho GTPase-activating protein gacU-like n=1 Tax=Thrips palmi TaxID=161013 RepID=A0A6P8YF82_THRPL|nr:rho GTPase-activating protein gacU-like [Thrips palmi]